jgi:hypothetical protein
MDLRLAEEIASDAEARITREIVDSCFAPEIRKAAELGLFKTLVVICRRGGLTYDEGSFEGARHLATTKHWFFVSDMQHKDERLRLMQDRTTRVIGASLRREDGNVNVKDKETKTVEIIPEVRFILTWPRRPPSPISEYNHRHGQPAVVLFPSLQQLATHAVACHLKAGMLQYEGCVVGNNKRINNLATTMARNRGLLPAELYRALGTLPDDSLRIFEAVITVHISTTSGASADINTWKTETGASLRKTAACLLGRVLSDTHLFKPDCTHLKDTLTLEESGLVDGVTLQALTGLEESFHRVQDLLKHRGREEAEHVSISEFLTAHRLESLVEPFKNHHLGSMLQLRELTHELLQEMGVSAVGTRLSLLQAVRTYFESML